MTTDVSATQWRRQAVGLATHIPVQAGALLRVWLRDPGVIIQAVVFPGFLLAMFHLVFGQSTTSLGNGDSIYGLTGLVALVGAMYGTLLSGLYLIRERDDGQLGRQWTMPVPRAGFLGGRLLAEAVRTLIGTVVLFVVAVPMGFRFSQGWGSGALAILVPAIFGLGVAIGIVAIATVVPRSTLEPFAVVFLLMLFFNSGFAPIDEYPGWLQPVVEYQPMSTAIDTMRGLTEGGAVVTPLLLTCGWTALAIVGCGWFAIRGYAKAARDGGR